MTSLDQINNGDNLSFIELCFHHKVFYESLKPHLSSLIFQYLETSSTIHKRVINYEMRILWCWVVCNSEEEKNSQNVSKKQCK